MRHLLISTPGVWSVRHDQRWSAGVQPRASERIRKVMEVSLNMPWFLVPDLLVWYFFETAVILIKIISNIYRDESKKDQLSSELQLSGPKRFVGARGRRKTAKLIVETVPQIQPRFAGEQLWMQKTRSHIRRHICKQKRTEAAVDSRKLYQHTDQMAAWNVKLWLWFYCLKHSSLCFGSVSH